MPQFNTNAPLIDQLLQRKLREKMKPKDIPTDNVRMESRFRVSSRGPRIPSATPKMKI